jgi:hypothetical protein
MDLLLDASGDLVFVNGASPVTQHTADVVAQRLRITLYTFYGEWFLNSSVGVPYFQQVFGKLRNKNSVDLLFQDIIRNDPDVIEIIVFDSTLAAAGREYEMTFQVRVSDNTESLPITINLGDLL